MPGGNYLLIYKLGTIIRDCMIVFISDLKSGYNQDVGGVLQGQTAELGTNVPISHISAFEFE